VYAGLYWHPAVVRTQHTFALLQVTEKGMEAHLIQPDIDRAGAFCMCKLLTAIAAYTRSLRQQMTSADPIEAARTVTRNKRSRLAEE